MRAITKLELLILTIITTLLIGTYVYHKLESWNYLDSFYCTAVTNIGYGDFHPITNLGKLFTIFFAFTGVGVNLFSFTVIASLYLERQEKLLKERLGNVVIQKIKTAKKRKGSNI